MRAAIPILAILLLAPTALAHEAASDCEEGQGWILYQHTDALRDAANAALGSQGAAAHACEGEQWDGQDATPDAPLLALGMGRDPNRAPSADPLQPAGVRAAGATGEGSGEVYLSAGVAFVGRFALYVGTCGAGDGLEGESGCRGGREARAGAYARDDTPGNAITRLVGPCSSSVIPECGMELEQDCDQRTYEGSVRRGERTCARDNTAFGLMLLLP